MAGMLLRRSFPLLTAILALACFATMVAACPFCEGQGRTLTEEVNQASLVLFGTLKNGKIKEETVELHIDAIVKKNDILNEKGIVTKVGGKQVITLARYVPDSEDKYKFLVFCDVYKGKIDAYGGKAVPANSDIDKYLQGALAVADKSVSTRLRFFLNYLDNADSEVSGDAYKEFANADYKDFRDMAKDIPAAKVAAWLQDAKTPGFRYGLYASMLGHCGKAEDAKLLRSMLDDPQKRVTSGVDGILAGYIMLQPKDGWQYLCGILKDSEREFLSRYAALRAARFFWEYRTDIVSKKDVVKGVCLLLDQNDIADLAIEDLRKWKSWDVADEVVALYDKKSHDLPIIRRAILRYALTCPVQCKATDLVQRLRKDNPEMVKDAEELLKLETDSLETTPSVTK